jgi:hypothetical protein
MPLFIFHDAAFDYAAAGDADADFRFFDSQPLFQFSSLSFIIFDDSAAFIRH